MPKFVGPIRHRGERSSGSAANLGGLTEPHFTSDDYRACPTAPILLAELIQFQPVIEALPLRIAWPARDLIKHTNQALGRQLDCYSLTQFPFH
jgi:hypothetical protein